MGYDLDANLAGILALSKISADAYGGMCINTVKTNYKKTLIASELGEVRRLRKWMFFFYNLLIIRGDYITFVHCLSNEFEFEKKDTEKKILFKYSGLFHRLILLNGSPFSPTSINHQPLDTTVS